MYDAQPVVPNSITFDVHGAFIVPKSHEVSTKQHDKYWQPFEFSSFLEHPSSIV
jgi:hypothetical protein